MEDKQLSFEQEIDKMPSSNVTQELQKLLERKHQIESKLSSLEKQIYALEGSYLQDTRNMGNILTGWDSYLNARGSGALKRPMKFKESDRLFSLSSVTAIKQTESSNTTKNEDTSPYTKADSGSGLSEDERPSKQMKLKKQGPGRPRKNRNVQDDDEY